jgi:hypothetical protein
MPKKYRRQVSKSAAFMPQQQQRTPTEFNPDYTYIRRDLRRIGMLAGSFFVVLVVLSFFLK